MVFALAHATGKIGRFTLIERWRNNERLLAPNENPLKVKYNGSTLGRNPLKAFNRLFNMNFHVNLLFSQILMKWGEYSHDVQFILQRSDQPKGSPSTTTDPATTKNPASTPPQASESPKKAKSTNDSPTMPYTTPEMQTKSRNPMSEAFNVQENRKSDIIGIVKGNYTVNAPLLLGAQIQQK